MAMARTWLKAEPQPALLGAEQREAEQDQRSGDAGRHADGRHLLDASAGKRQVAQRAPDRCRGRGRTDPGLRVAAPNRTRAKPISRATGGVPHRSGRRGRDQRRSRRLRHSGVMAVERRADCSVSADKSNCQPAGRTRRWRRQARRKRRATSNAITRPRAAPAAPFSSERQSLAFLTQCHGNEAPGARALLGRRP